MSARIVVLAGDGVGPEVTSAAVRVLEQVSARHALKLEFENALIGGAAYDAAGSPLPDATVAACKASKGILLGAVGGPKWADIPVQHRPEQGLLAIRKALGLFANLRPVATTPELAAASPLKPEKLKGVDILVIRELTGGIYFGKRSRSAEAAFDTCEYTAAEYRELVAPQFESVEIYGLFHSGKLRLHELALKAGWDRVHPALGLTKRFYDRFVPAISVADFALRREGECDLDRALDFIALCRS